MHTDHEEKERAAGYRDLAKAALSTVAEYRKLSGLLEERGVPELAAEYRLMANQALARAQEWKTLADRVAKQPITASWETCFNPS